jgi:hypothetical protein
MAWVSHLPGLAWSGGPADLGQLLLRLATDSPWRAALGQQARRRYQQLFARKVWQRRLQGLGP